MGLPVIIAHLRHALSTPAARTASQRAIVLEVIPARDVRLSARFQRVEQSPHRTGKRVGKPRLRTTRAMPGPVVADRRVIDRAGHANRPAGPADRAGVAPRSPRNASVPSDSPRPLRATGPPRRRPSPMHWRRRRIRECSRLIRHGENRVLGSGRVLASTRVGSPSQYRNVSRW